jgi:hypothetical protein
LVRDPGLTGVSILTRRIVRNRLKVIFVNFDCLTVLELDPVDHARRERLVRQPSDVKNRKNRGYITGVRAFVRPITGDRNPRLHRGFHANRIVVIKS